MNLQSSKNLGGIGAILLFVAVLLNLVQPFIGGIVGLIGVIMILVALHGLSDYYRERGIFTNALYGVLIVIIGMVVVTVVAFTVVLANVYDLISIAYPGWIPGDWASLQGMTPDPNAFTNFDFSTLIPLLAGLAIAAVILYVAIIVATYFIWRSTKQVSAKSTVGLFGTAGLLLFIGAFLTIIVIGVFLMWIAALLLAIAFFQLNPEQPEAVPPPPPSV